jgi:hypothetical protein
MDGCSVCIYGLAQWSMVGVHMTIGIYGIRSARGGASMSICRLLSIRFCGVAFTLPISTLTGVSIFISLKDNINQI